MNFTALTEYLDYLPTWRIPGVDCIVMQDHRVLYRHTAGFRDLEAREPVREDDLYDLYSCTKPVTCAAALSLFERGKFLMDDPLSDYLPEYAHMQVREKHEDGSVTLRDAAGKIRIRHLFTMTAGLNYDWGAPAIAALKQENPAASTREVVRAIAASPLSFDPGDRWQYSLCHDVLAGLVEVIADMPFEDYVKKTIFDPLGMKDASFFRTPETSHRMAKLYRYNDQTGCCDLTDGANDHRATSRHASGGAGLCISVADYALFADAMSCGGVGQNGARILSRACIDMMRCSPLTDAQLRSFNWPQHVGYKYAYGVRTMAYPAQGGALSPVGEFGWGGAAGAYVLMDPQNRLSMVYAQHLLNNQEPIVHSRLRNLLYAAMED